MIQVKSQIKVLIAERAISVAETIAQNLKNQGYAIAGIVNSAEKAIEFATLSVPDIVLLDLPLPGELDVFTVGWKIVSELHCPVVYMAIQRDDLPTETACQSTQLNPYGFLVKPFTADELTATIEQTLEQYWRQRQALNQQWANCELDHISDSQFLSLLNVAQSVSPKPRIFFEHSELRIYSTLEGANILSQVCQSHVPGYRYQVFAWNWETGRYYLNAIG